MTSAASAETPGLHGSRRPVLLLAALGVVYGDIGTSPLYTIREAFGLAGLPLGEATVLGVLSLIFWALLMVVTLKYVAVIMQADNQGEGGVLALATLAQRGVPRGGRRQRTVLVLAMVGAALFYGDCILTPAISVLSAVEGLEVATPAFAPYIVPIALAILAGLFVMQRRGTAGVGLLFGPVICLWFATLATLGVLQIVANPGVLRALNPVHVLNLFAHHGWEAFVALGAVVLAVTGAEALYADMGHFGRWPIRFAWFALVFPSLVLNYFGQGALLLQNPGALVNPFYLLAPSWALYPLVMLATWATVIASQAVISGAFSLARQAVQLGYLPRLEIRHTSEHQIGQVYLPRVNWALMVAVGLVVVGFGSSSRLAAAYGIAVLGTMIITVILAFIVAVTVWRWQPLIATLPFAVFLAVDLGFFSSTALKIPAGGWLPIVFAAAVFALMSTWRKGREALFQRLYRGAPSLPSFLASLRREQPLRVHGTAVFPTGNPDAVPRALLHNLKHNKVLHERVVVLTVLTEDVPRVPEAERVEVEHLGGNFHRVLMHYGFMEHPDVTLALMQSQLGAPEPTYLDTSFFLSRESLIPSDKPDLPRWRERIFIQMSNTALRATSDCPRTGWSRSAAKSKSRRRRLPPRPGTRARAVAGAPQWRAHLPSWAPDLPPYPVDEMQAFGGPSARVKPVGVGVAGAPSASTPILQLG
jgi:KUP system potassium uptake protein